jgi:hypothetical protein
MNYIAHYGTDLAASLAELITPGLYAPCYFCKELKNDWYYHLSHYLCDECCWKIAAEGGW